MGGATVISTWLCGGVSTFHTADVSHRYSKHTGVSYSSHSEFNLSSRGLLNISGCSFPDKYGLLHWSLNFHLSDLQSTKNDSTSWIIFVCKPLQQGKRSHQLPIAWFLKMRIITRINGKTGTAFDGTPMSGVWFSENTRGQLFIQATANWIHCHLIKINPKRDAPSKIWGPLMWISETSQALISSFSQWLEPKSWKVIKIPRR